MKKLRVLLIVLFGILILTGCTKKEAVKASDFAKKAGSYVVLNNYTSYYGIAKEAYQTNNDQYKVIFIEAKNMSDIKGMYIDEAKNIYSKAGIVDENSADEGTNAINNKYTKKTASGKNWSSLEITTDLKYFYMIYVDDTILLIESNKEDKDLMIKVRDAINY